MLPPGSRCITIYGLGYVVEVRLDETGQPTAYAVALDSHRRNRRPATIVPAVHVTAWAEEEIP